VELGAEAFTWQDIGFAPCVLVKISLENLRNRDNSFDPKAVFVLDSSGAKYENAGTHSRDSIGRSHAGVRGV
jgi:hypothetical protein